MCLLEKAWAKVHGSYGMIINSYPELVLATLTNKPIQVICHKNKQLKKFDKDKLWSKLKCATKMTCLMGACSNKAGYNVSNLLSVHEVLSNGKLEKLVKIQHHRKKFQNQSLASIQDDDWTFFLYEDYLAQFDNTIICFDSKMPHNVF